MTDARAKELLLLQWFASLVVLMGYVGLLFEPTHTIIEGLLIGDLLWLLVSVCRLPEILWCFDALSVASNCWTCGTPSAGLVRRKSLAMKSFAALTRADRAGAAHFSFWITVFLAVARSWFLVRVGDARPPPPSVAAPQLPPSSGTKRGRSRSRSAAKRN